MGQFVDHDTADFDDEWQFPITREITEIPSTENKLAAEVESLFAIRGRSTGGILGISYTVHVPHNEGNCTLDSLGGISVLRVGRIECLKDKEGGILKLD
jgi:hypothetical protein